MLIREAMARASEQLSAVTEVPQLEAKWLMEWHLSVSGTYLLLNGSEALSSEQVKGYFDAVSKRLEQVPLQYITGEQEFMGLTFKVSPAVLIPRRDTECLVELVVGLYDQQVNPIQAADLGSGSGAIGICLTKFLPTIEMTGVDFSETAIEMTSANARELLNAAEAKRYKTWHGDMFEYLKTQAEATLDLIVSNPPYIPTADIETLSVEVKSHEPMSALDGGKDGYDFYRRLVKEAVNYLKSGGRMFFEVGHDQAETVRQLFLDDGGYEDIQCYRDLQGILRIVGARKI